MIGVRLSLPAGWSVARAEAPMNAMFLGEALPPFRSNASILLQVDKTDLEAYAARLGSLSPLDLGRALTTARRLKVAGHPTIIVEGAPAHPTLKLSNIQAMVDVGPHKLILTATSLTDRFAALRNDFQAVLDSLVISARAPLDLGPGALYRDRGGRFALTLPPRFHPTRPVGAENVLFIGPVDEAMHVVGTVQVIEIPRDWVATAKQLSIMKRGIPGGKTGQMLLDGKVLTRPSQPDGLLMLMRYRPEDTEIHELVAEVPAGKLLVRAKFRGPGDTWALLDPALRASLETLVAPAPALPAAGASAAAGASPASSAVPASSPSPVFAPSASPSGSP